MRSSARQLALRDGTSRGMTTSKWRPATRRQSCGDWSRNYCRKRTP